MNYKTVTRAIDALSRTGQTLSSAESCTGGLIAKLITDVSGASDVFEGTVVSYSNHVKEKVLGVSSETLKLHGAVSEETAKEMCEGVRRITDADIGISTTGIAGPTGGTPEKPVGMVCFGISSHKGTKTYTRYFGEDLSRDAIRESAAEFALFLVVEECM